MARTPIAHRDARAVEPLPKVVVVDDHLLFRSGLIRLLGDEGVEIAGEADSGAAALALVAQTSPDVVLLDLNLPDMSGIEATRRLMGRHPALRVVVLTVIESQADVIESIVAGACGYLLKDSPIEDITHAIDVAVQGESMIDPAIATKLLAHVRATGRATLHNGDHHLSTRELDVLRLLAEGRDNRDIAAELFISQSTVKHHISSIIGKLGVGNRIQAAVLAVREGLI